MTWTLNRYEETAMPPEMDTAIRAGLCEAFPDDVRVFSATRAWNGSAPEFSLTAETEKGLAGHVGVVRREITVGGVTLVVGGIQNVFAVPSLKGSGLARELLKAAVEEMGRREWDCGLLFCLPVLAEKVYGPVGWATIDDRRVVRRENGAVLPLPEKNIAMWCPLRVKQLPAGDIDLQGNDW